MGCLSSKEAEGMSPVDGVGSRSHKPENGAAPKTPPAKPHKVKNRILEKSGDKVLADYEMKEKLGEGGFGTVHKAYDKKKEKYVALKRIPKAKMITEKDRVAVRSEIKIMQHLNGNDAVVLIEDAFEDDHNVYVALELCEGGDMFQALLAKGHYSEADAARICRSMLEMVAYCHDQGVAHRDLKPENFLFDSKSDTANLKATDFGLSTFIGRDQKLDLPCGTPMYIAPEVLKRDYNEKCDIWSTGVVVYIMLSGRVPFHGKTMDQIIKSTLNGKYDMSHESWKTISNDAKDLVVKMLTYEPNKRETARSLLEHPWLQPNAASSEPLVNAVFENLKSFTAMNKLKKKAVQIMATNLPVSQIEKLREAFSRADEDGSGTLTIAELKHTISRLNLTVTDDELQAMFDTYDVDENGEIDYEEFVTACTDLNNIRTLENMKHAFHTMDADGNGQLSVDEVVKALRDLNVDEEEARRLIAENDKNKDGVIDYQEFVEMMTDDLGLNAGVHETNANRMATLVEASG